MLRTLAVASFVHSPCTRLRSFAYSTTRRLPFSTTTVFAINMSASVSETTTPTPQDYASKGTARAKRVSARTDLVACSQRLQQGELVAFPTETVYGLGCHALNETAILKVFEAKERPLTDPLIVHVLDSAAAFELWQADPSTAEGVILSKLCSRFWPGPLTLVATAKPGVPGKLMAGTGFVACRSPASGTARALLETSQLPLAAPSANKFGHVSPTTAQHVYDDLWQEDVWILEDDMLHDSQHQQPRDRTCQVGVESTVAKLEASKTDENTFVLTVLRQGAVSAADLASSLHDIRPHVEVRAKTKRATDESVANVAPGQTIRHYSPNVVSYMVSAEASKMESSEVLSKAVVIDYGQRLAAWKDMALAYRDLSPTGNSTEAAQGVFETLRWAEGVANAGSIFFPDLSSDEGDNDDALRLAVQDRLTRAASGVTVTSLEQLPER